MATPRFRKPKPFGSRISSSEVLQPKKCFYIVCEGKRTENQYFNGIFNYRSKLNINQIVDIVVLEQDGKEHISHPLHIVKGCERLLKNEKERNLKLSNFDSDIDELWVIFDRDPNNFFKYQFDDVTRICNENNIKIGFTNPNFEFWLFLHLANPQSYDKDLLFYNRRSSRRKRRFLEEELNRRLEKGYAKNNIKFEQFLPYINLAIEQEKMFEQDVDKIFYRLGSNIGTLISKMQKTADI